MLQKLCSCGAVIAYGKHKCSKCAAGRGRNKAHDRFYHSKAWRDLANWVRQRDRHLCRMCGGIGMEVDHILPLDTPEGWARRLDATNCRTLCTTCHNARHGRFTPGAAKKV